jgi:ubiquinone biosynthesis protein
VADAIERDLRSARAVRPLVARLRQAERPVSVRVLERALDDLAAGLRRETDLLAEAETLIDFRRRVAERNPRVVVPLCHRELCRPQALVMEALEGESLARFRERTRNDPEAARLIASLAFKEILQQVFEDGRFHADPHAGNLLVLEDGRLGLVDLGLTGRFGPEERRSITHAVRAFVGRDPAKVIRALLELGAAPPGFQLDSFQKDVLEVVGQRGEAQEPSGGDEPTRLERLVNDLLAVARRHEVQIPPSTTLLVKALVTIEGVARSLDPELDVARAALPVVIHALRPRWLDRLAFWR